jgi:hypothetical protein
MTWITCYIDTPNSIGYSIIYRKRSFRGINPDYFEAKQSLGFYELTMETIRMLIENELFLHFVVLGHDTNKKSGISKISFPDIFYCYTSLNILSRS